MANLDEGHACTTDSMGKVTMMDACILMLRKRTQQSSAINSKTTSLIFIARAIPARRGKDHERPASGRIANREEDPQRRGLLFAGTELGACLV